MASLDLERIRKVSTLPSLLKYLRDELGWPIDQDAVEDDLTFEYQPEELGISTESAVAIKEIKQIRPLDHRQPWGVFWVNFEKKRLPMVMLRRILGHLVVMKRASADRAKRRAWHLHDLLFISSYGDDIDRAITFAHFTHDPESPGDLPVLKVLGWDGSDTVLHLADAHETLSEKLRWPDDPNDLDNWRKSWGSAFSVGYRQVIRTTEELEKELAKLALSIRRRTSVLLAKETDKGPLKRLYAAFQTALIHDLTEDDFADVIAQTLTYGLLIAKFSRPAGISADNLVDMIPETNPFLRDLLRTFLEIAGRKGNFDFDELGIQDVVEMLNHADTEAVKRDFGNKTRQEDPVIHFYEHFLAAYDRQKKVQRGVFYTPQPVVSYIVRSVHELLQTEFGLEDGLASTVTWGELRSQKPNVRIPEGTKADEFFVNILDPATGTATFLVEVIEVIFIHLRDKWKKAGSTGMPTIHGKGGAFASFTEYWNAYVPAVLLSRLYGYELMMAPYTIAHMKLGLKLSEINTRLGQPGYQFKFKGRAHIYLTNSLEPSDEKQMKLAGFDALAHEAAAVNRVKGKTRFTVVIGNPPYSNFGQLNRIPYILDLLNDYKKGLKEKKLNLDDDFIKFFRFSQEQLMQVDLGVLGLITNHTFVGGLTHRQMRRSLLETFGSMFILDLHGSQVIPEAHPLGVQDENVFDIKQGVAVTLALRSTQNGRGSVRHLDLWGSRDDKYRRLKEESVSESGWAMIQPEAPHFFLEPRGTSSIPEYEAFFSLREIMPVGSSGIQTKRDALFVDPCREILSKRMREVIRHGATDVMFSMYPLAPSSGWSPTVLKTASFSVKNVRPYLYRPFDTRWVYYDPALLGRARYDIFRHLLRENVALVSMRQTVDDEFHHVFCTAGLCDINLLINHHVSDRVFPLYLYEQSGDLLAADGERRANLSSAFVKALAETTGLSWLADGTGDLAGSFGPEDILAYIYAVLHSQEYRARYWNAIRTDFPRVPIPRTSFLFCAMVRLGRDLLQTHLAAEVKPKRAKWVGSVPGALIGKVEYEEGCIWIDSDRKDGIHCVDPLVWCFRVGGYRVIAKWLNERRGQHLSDEDVHRLLMVIGSLEESVRLMFDVDTTVRVAGGWPSAFLAKRTGIVTA